MNKFILSSIKCGKLEKFLKKSSMEEQAHKMTQLLPAVKRRINFLKKLQLETLIIAVKFYNEVHALECTYHKLCIPMYERRNLVVSGVFKPTGKKAQWPSNDEAKKLENQLKSKAKIEKEKTSKITQKYPETNNEPDRIGIPEFWLTIFKNDDLLNELVQPPDEPILTHLQDIKVDCSENPMSFLLAFHFSPNQYFTNSVLTKEYFMKCEPDKNDLIKFSGPEIYKCKGCTINWNKGMDVTLKTVKKKQRYKSRGVVCTIFRTVETKSFFHFFAPVEIPKNAKQETIGEVRQLFTTHVVVGFYLRQKVVPRAVLFYLAETIKDENGNYKNNGLDDISEESNSDKEDSDKAAKNENCKQQ